ncbi:hypothetical protein JRQ81_000451 [Phrynocephalus forsythii]|uniref:Uncharacterized protein n=1 Tax=Phrynocephalus forsythii TaxID=171643 RepID=A0A9Q0Y7P3_9SAUR|nr:hypothetical protein JRQ81_000451 [Phrynocephalus forsythii]
MLPGKVKPYLPNECQLSKWMLPMIKLASNPAKISLPSVVKNHSTTITTFLRKVQIQDICEALSWSLWRKGKNSNL